MLLLFQYMQLPGTDFASQNPKFFVIVQLPHFIGRSTTMYDIKYM